MLVLPLLAGKGRLYVPVPRVASVYCSVRFVQLVFDMTSELFWFFLSHLIDVTYILIFTFRSLPALALWIKGSKGMMLYSQSQKYIALLFNNENTKNS